MHRMTILHDTHHNRVSQTAPVDVHDSWTGDQCGEGFGDMGVCVLVSGLISIPKEYDVKIIVHDTSEGHDPLTNQQSNALPMALASGGHFSYSPLP